MNLFRARFHRWFYTIQLASLEFTWDGLDRKQHGLKLSHSAARHRPRHLSLSLVGLVLVLLVAIVDVDGERRRRPSALRILVPIRVVLPRRHLLPEEILDNRILHPRVHVLAIRISGIRVHFSRRAIFIFLTQSDSFLSLTNWNLSRYFISRLYRRST